MVKNVNPCQKFYNILLLRFPHQYCGTSNSNLLENTVKEPNASDQWISLFPYLHDDDFREIYALPHKFFNITCVTEFSLVNTICTNGA